MTSDGDRFIENIVVCIASMLELQRGIGNCSFSNMHCSGGVSMAKAPKQRWTRKDKKTKDNITRKHGVQEHRRLALNQNDFILKTLGYLY